MGFPEGATEEPAGMERDSGGTSPKVGLKPGMVYMLANSGVVAASIYLAKIAHERLGADLFTTGLIVSASNITAFFSTFIFGRHADVHGLRKVMQLGLVLTGLALLLQLFAYYPITLMCVRALMGLCMGMYPGALIAYASISGVPMGRFSSFLALGWAVGSVLAGIGTMLYPSEYAPVFVVGALLMFAGYLGTLTLPAIKEKRHSIPFFPKAILRKNAHVYFPYLLRHLGANTVWAIFPLYLTSLGKGVEHVDLWIGIVYFMNSFCQFIFMPFLDRIKGNRGLIQGGLILSVLVFIVYAQVPNIYIMVGVQALLALSWALLYVGSLRELLDTNPEKATSSGLLTSTISLASSIGPIIGGIVAGSVAHYHGDAAGYMAVLYFASITALVSLALFWLFERKKGAGRP